MTTPQDLLLLALDAEDGSVGQGDLSLALAGAELADLVGAGVASLDGDRVVPGTERALGDELLDAAGRLLVREEPYESVADWLWHRGEGLSATYVAAWEASGQAPKPRRRFLRGAERTPPGHSPAGRRAAERWASGEPVLVGLAAASGVRDLPPTTPAPPADDDTVSTILAAVDDAVTELEAVRHRRGVEEAAYDNIWRAP